MTLEEVFEKHGVTDPYGISGVGPGWVPLVDKLIADLIELGWDKDLHQCKEKFGGLRFYIGASSPEIVNRIEMAELDSIRTCEWCGAPGKKRRSGSWLITRCDEHSAAK